MQPPYEIACYIADTCASGVWQRDDLVARISAVVGGNRRWIESLAGRMLAEFGTTRRPSRRSLAAFLTSDRGLERAIERYVFEASPSLDFEPRMRPAEGTASRWNLPVWESTTELAQALNISPSHLDWFADSCGMLSKGESQPLNHYRYRWVKKRHGWRLIEAPKPRLKALQRQLLEMLLDRVPAHEAAHGFRAARSIVSFAQPHTSADVVLKMDLKDFFPSVSAQRITGLWRLAGYPEEVARRLTGLCVNQPPEDVWRSFPATAGVLARMSTRDLYHRPHLPQGAPTSPAIANLITFRLDCRLAGLARVAGAQYTRYADDLLFSGEASFARQVRPFRAYAASIALEEGFRVLEQKTRIMQRSVRQRAAGLVLNNRVNVDRREFDRLKATLHNARRFGPSSQNRAGHVDFRAHLAGRVAFVAFVNPEKARKLRTILEEIDWTR